MVHCIYCGSLDVIETKNPHTGEYEYRCADCGEEWNDDESEFESLI